MPKKKTKREKQQEQENTDPTQVEQVPGGTRTPLQNPMDDHGTAGGDGLTGSDELAGTGPSGGGDPGTPEH